MKTKRAITALLIFAMMILAAPSAFAVTLTVGTVSGGEGQTTVQIPITVDNPVGIVGAAFTLQYDTSALTVTVDSTFFNTFANQFVGTPNETTAPTSVTVDSQSYDQPLIANDIVGTGTRIAAARCTPGDASSSNTLFTLTVVLNTGAAYTTYPITVVPTVVSNTDAGYAAEGETIPMLVGSDLSVTDLTDPSAFPILLDPANGIGTVVAGSVTFTESSGITDTDGDGIADDWETTHFGNLTTANATSDYDGDGLTDLQEYGSSTDPKDGDSDNDGYTDGNDSNPLTADSPGGTGYDPATDSRTYDISGTVNYSGTQTGTLYVAVFDDAAMTNPIDSTFFTNPSFPQAYSFTGLAAEATYYLRAFIDVSGGTDGVMDADEARGSLEVNIASDMSGSDITVSEGPFQIVSATPSTINAGAGANFSIHVEYTTSDNDQTLTGLGLRIHYDSSKLTWNSFSNVLSNSKTGEDTSPVDDTSDFDNDPSTDKYLQVAWSDLGGKWPNTVLPVALYTVNFTADASLTEGETSVIRFTASSTATSHSFASEPVIFKVQSFNLDIDGNGTADALTDGLLVIRYIFGFRGSTLISDAIGAGATRTTAADIEAYLAQLMP